MGSIDFHYRAMWAFAILAAALSLGGIWWPSLLIPAGGAVICQVIAAGAVVYQIWQVRRGQ